MNILKLILFLPLLIGELACFSQMEESYKDEYNNLSKDSLVQVAITQLTPIIKKRGANFSQIDFEMYSIIVKANSQSIMVWFKLPIKYLQTKSSYYGNMVVDIKTNFYSIQQISNPKDYGGKPQFYSSSPALNKNVQFVLNAIESSKEIDPSFNEEIIISEYKEYYEVTTQSTYHFSSLKVAKDSGEIFDWSHESLEPEEEEADNYVEIID